MSGDTAAPPALCVYCRHQPAVSAYAPFCSERCKMADLGRWLTGAYAVGSRRPDAERSASGNDGSDDWPSTDIDGLNDAEESQ